MVRSRFADDRRRGDEVAELVYENIFLGASALGFSEDKARLVRFEESPEQQYAGADIVVYGDAGPVSVEVKSAVDTAGPNKHTGESLMTFSQEVAYINAEGNVREGWLVDAGKRSDVFAFCWIPKVRQGMVYEDGRNYYRIRNVEDIVQLDIAMVKREKLVGVLLQEFSYGCANAKVEGMNAWLKQEAVRMRSEGESASYMGSFKMILSKQLGEGPVNVLVPKTKLEEAACRRYRMTRSYEPSRFEWAAVPF